MTTIPPHTDDHIPTLLAVAAENYSRTQSGRDANLLAHIANNTDWPKMPRCRTCIAVQALIRVGCEPPEDDGVHVRPNHDVVQMLLAVDLILGHTTLKEEIY